MREKYALRVKDLQIEIKNTVIDSTWNTSQSKTALRLYKDGKLRLSLLDGPYDEEKIYEKLSDSMDLGRVYPVSLQRNRQENLISGFQKCDYAQLISVLEKVMKKLSVQFSSLRLDGSFHFEYQEISMSNEQTLYLNFEDRLLYGNFRLSDRENARQSAEFSLVFRNFEEQSIFSAFAEYFSAYLHPVTLESGQEYPVLFSTGNPTPLRQLEKDLQPDMFHSGMSLLSGSAGRQIFDENFTLYASRSPEDAKVRSHQMIPFFDSEGSVNPLHRKALIDAGVLLTPYTCKQTAERYELENTGSASVNEQGYPYASPEGFCIKPSDLELKTLLKGEKGILICDVQEDAFDDRGQFLLRADSAFLHDGERLIGKLPSLRLSSDLFSIFRSGYIGVSSDHLLHSDIDRALLIKMRVELLHKEV
ncbi:MAG: metallopeptidase TldD-related protein [Peptostreptococcaceae bacterium]|nr:metallopeptidase TldD-related protein [Peptostreptococcaceae bacterium]